MQEPRCDVKKTYQEPQVIVYGTVKELTQTMGAGMLVDNILDPNAIRTS